MKTIKYNDLVQKVEQMILEASYNLPSDVLRSLKENSEKEKSPLGKSIINNLIKNAGIASSDSMPICQDTGVAVFFVEMGDSVKLDRGNIKQALILATANAYKNGYLRKSMVSDPVYNRKNTGDNTPPIIHFDPVEGDTLKIQFAPKGGGAENMSGMVMLKPLEGEEGIIGFVCDLVKKAGGNPCPPIIIGVGIGGNFELAPKLAKKALLRKIGSLNPDPNYRLLEEKILESVNRLGVGPQGLGGTVTASAVHINFFPCHIASLPVAVNLNCHAARHSEIVL